MKVWQAWLTNICVSIFSVTFQLNIYVTLYKCWCSSSSAFTIGGCSFWLIMKRNRKYSTKGIQLVFFCPVFNELLFILYLFCSKILKITMKLLTVSALLCAMVALTTAAGEYHCIIFYHVYNFNETYKWIIQYTPFL